MTQRWKATKCKRTNLSTLGKEGITNESEQTEKTCQSKAISPDP